MIEAEALVKRYGDTTAVAGLDFAVRPGIVTGFLGPNGAGKSTTMRMIMGLDRPTAGDVKVNGKHYRDHAAPLQEVGALLEARSSQPGRTAYNHLRVIAASNGIPRSRVDEVVAMVGLGEVAGKRVRGFSLGMGQRLGIAGALLGDPATIILDEPVNGLDPEGIVWIRNLLKHLASGGRTVFVSSHLMSEMSQTAEHLIVIGKGKLIADMSVEDFIKKSSRNYVLVKSPQAGQLRQAIERAGGTVVPDPDGGLEVTSLTASQIGDAAAQHALTLHELSPQLASLEEAFMELTRDAVEFQATVGSGNQS